MSLCLLLLIGVVASTFEYCARFDDEAIDESLRARVAVIGGGIAGASFAHFARRSMPRLDITLFEADARLGGRIHNIKVIDEGVPG